MIAPAAEPLTQPGEAADAAPGSGLPAPGTLSLAWRRMRGPLAVLAFVVFGVAVIVLLAPRPKSNTYLDPASADGVGTRALVDILANRGFQVTSVYSPADALAATSRARPAVTLVITRPDLLTSAQRARLTRADADLVLIEPGESSLAQFAPEVSVADPNAPFREPVDPKCGMIGARLAGSANVGAITYHGPPRAIACYPVDGNPSVVRYRGGLGGRPPGPAPRGAGHTITILGSGLPLSNGWLAQEGNAALALNLLNANRTIIWLTPEPTVASPPPRAASQQPRPSLVPGAAWLVVLQLFVALALAALWRVRRFGPLISEQLPVIVRASETVEGHARLYQARRARDRAAAALREDMLGRLQPALGLVPGAPADAVADSIASRSRRTRQEILAIVYGPAPATDADLVKLASALDELEREVRSQ